MDAPRNFNPWLVESADGDPAEMEDWLYIYKNPGIMKREIQIKFYRKENLSEHY